MMNRKTKDISLAQSTQHNVPIKSISDGIIITKDGRYVQVIEVMPTNFHMATETSQLEIINSFEQFLKIAPSSLQFKVITTSRDMSSQYDIMRNDMLTETNDNAYDLQAEQLERFQQMSRENISRRFFMAYQYEESNLLGQPSFRDIRQNMFNIKRQLCSYLEACGNSVLSIANEDLSEHISEILYTILNRDESAVKPFQSVFKDVAEKYFADEEFKRKKLKYISPLESISPQLIDFSYADFVRVNDTYKSYLYIPGDNGYNPRITAGWVNLFLNLGNGVDFDMYFEKRSRENAKRSLRTTLSFKNVEALDARDLQGSSFSLNNAIQSGTYLLNGLENFNDLWYMSSILTVSADSPKQLQTRVTEISKCLSSNDITVRLAKFEQEQLFISSLPLCALDRNIHLKAKRNILTQDAASAYPFISFEMNDEGGIVFGKQAMNRSNVVINIFDNRKYTNGNMFISGTSGAGKSSLLKMIMLRMRMRHVPVFAIIPEKQDEFRRVCRAVGGQFIEIGAGSPTRINVMEIFEKNESITQLLDDYTYKTSILAEKVQSLKVFFRLFITDLSFEDKQILDEALMRTYRSKGFTEDNNSFWEDKENTIFRSNDMPVLEDLYSVLTDMNAVKLANVLRMFVSGSGSSFNGKTNIDVNNPFCVIGLEKTNGELLSASMYLAVDFLFSKIKEDKSARKVLVIDEFWRLMLNEGTANKVLGIVKVIRAYGGSLCLATQRLKDAVAYDEGKYGEGILSSCAFKVLLKHEESDLQMIQESINLSKQETDILPSLPRGTGLVVANKNNTVVEFTMTPKEHDLITTDPADLQRRKKIRMEQMKNNQHTDTDSAYTNRFILNDIQPVYVLVDEANESRYTLMPEEDDEL